MSPERDALYQRFVKARADLTVIGNMLQSDPQHPRRHTAADTEKWAEVAGGYSGELDRLLTDTYDYLLKTAGNESRP